MKVKIRDIGRVVTGRTPPTANIEYWGGDIPFITPEDLQNGKDIISTRRKITSSGMASVATASIPKGAVCVSCIGNIGYAAIASRQSVSNQQINSIIPSADYNGEYVYYLMKVMEPYFKVLEGNATTVPILNKSDFESIEVDVLPLKSQRKVVSVLSALDRKIALNRRKIATLEKMAKEIYDYWFVQYDFPDKNGRPYKSSGGEMVYSPELKREIPKGWRAKRLDEIAEIFNGATPSTAEDENYGGDIAWITPKDLSDQKSKFVFRGERSITKTGYESCGTHMLPAWSILLSSRAPIGLIAISANDVCTNQGFKSFALKDVDDAFCLYYYLQDHIGEIEKLGSGTTFKEVSRGAISEFLIPYITDRALYRKWVDLAKSIFESQKLEQRRIAELTQLRDFLLPLLMNGQVKLR